MGEAWVLEGRAVVEETIEALGDEVTQESKTWWQYVLVAAELGHDCVRELVREVAAVEAAGGMTTQDGSRRRTPGGVFFVLAYERLGPKRKSAVRWRADRRFQEGMLQRFLRLFALVLPANGALPALITEAATPEPAPPAPIPSPEAMRRQKPEAVEVLVVRRRPAASATPIAKAGPLKPGAGG